jgi:hypothetical protein
MSIEPPASVEERTQAWLEETLDPGIAGDAASHVPVYAPDGTPQHMSRTQFGRLRRKLKIFRWLERLDFNSFIDVASGWEHYPYLVRRRYGIDAVYYSDMVHRMNLPLDGPLFGKLDHAVTVRLPRLPFRDRAFDVVLCSEVLEHLVRPIESLAELWRITARYLIVTSLEALSVNQWQRLLSHWSVDTSQPHVERNFFVLRELQALLGGDTAHENLQYAPFEPVSPFASWADQDAVLARLRTADLVADRLCRAVADSGHGPGALGILFVKARSGAAVRPAKPNADAELARWLISEAAAEERALRDVLIVAAAWEQGKLPYPHEEAERLKARPVEAALLKLLRCPDCAGSLTGEGTSLRCTECQRVFASDYGVPLLTSTLDTLDTQALNDFCGADPERLRVAARVMRRLRRNEHPPGALRRALWRVTGRGAA